MLSKQEGGWDPPLDNWRILGENKEIMEGKRKIHNSKPFPGHIVHTQFVISRGKNVLLVMSVNEFHCP